MLKEAGLSYQKPRRLAAEDDEDEQKEFRDNLKKAAGDGRHSSLYRSDQEIRASRAACRAETTRASVELSDQRDWTCFLGAITVLGDRFYSRFEEYVTTNPSPDISGRGIAVVTEIMEQETIVLTLRKLS